MRTLVCLFLLLSMPVPRAIFAAGPVELADAWINEAPPTINVHAGYIRIKNKSDREIRLLSADSDAYEKIEFHLSKITDGIASMQKQENITIASNSEFAFSPGAYHLMLINNKRPLRAGDSVQLLLYFDHDMTLQVEAEVRKADPHAQHHHHH